MLNFMEKCRSRFLSKKLRQSRNLCGGNVHDKHKYTYVNIFLGRGVGLPLDFGRLLLLLLGRRPRLRGRIPLQHQRTHGNAKFKLRYNILKHLLLQLCEPYYLSNNALVFASCLFYFPTTMFLMYREAQLGFKRV